VLLITSQKELYGRTHRNNEITRRTFGTRIESEMSLIRRLHCDLFFVRVHIVVTVVPVT
jgi:hypothetical protein